MDRILRIDNHKRKISTESFETKKTPGFEVSR